ncbi:mitochondrial ribosomal protein S23 [Megachile rotundata]|uniref:mitochondrial ribosomal protein S23 n=1 Tax=Megachile rotundata TaxID=143995 RepID=UPI000258F148|nr:PREDICTED: probable 28S ribosomal protein S23, mitochondrial [Megachile rotundata]
MAHSRAERIGTIFSRITALWQNKALPETKLPLWYDVYKAFPPKYEPRFDRPAPQTPIRNILYKEDAIRAKFHNDVALRMMDLKSNTISRTQLFCNICDSLQKAGIEEAEIYDKALFIYTTAFEKSIKPQTKERKPQIKESKPQTKEMKPWTEETRSQINDTLPNDNAKN